MYLDSASAILAAQPCRPIQDWESEAVARAENLTRMMACGRAQLYQTMIDPSEVAAEFGLPTALAVASGQQASLPTRAGLITNPASQPSPSAFAFSRADLIANAPAVTGEPQGCARTIVPRPVMPAQPHPTMPQQAPIVINTPAGSAPQQVPTAPQWTNLCWALRNQAVDPSQFAAGDYQKLQLKCSQLGYAGTCTPPPNTADYLRIAKAAGTLPMIPITDAVLNSIPAVSSDLFPLSCQESYTQAGLTGYAPPWSDAWVMDQTSASSSSGAMGWIAANPWLALGIGVGAIALLAQGQKKGRRR